MKRRLSLDEKQEEETTRRAGCHCSRHNRPRVHAKECPRVSPHIKKEAQDFVSTPPPLTIYVHDVIRPVTNFILSSGSPFTLADSPEFRTMIEEMLGSTNVRFPTSKSISDKVPPKYYQEFSPQALVLNSSLVEAYMKILGRADTRPSVILDMWRAPTNVDYLGVVVTFLYDFKLYDLTLGLFRVKDHSSETLYEAVITLLATYKITPAAFVSDNARTQVAANEKLAEWSDRVTLSEILPDGVDTQNIDLSVYYVEGYFEDEQHDLNEYLHKFRPADAYTSACHSFELVIKHMLRPLESVLTSIRTVSARLRNNSDLKNSLLLLNLKCPCIRPDVSTRWSSTCLMIEGVVVHFDDLAAIRSAFIGVPPDKVEFYAPLCHVLEHIDTLRTVLKFLKRIRKTVACLEGSSYPTLNRIIGFVFTLKDKLERDTSQDPRIQEIREIGLAQLSARFGYTEGPAFRNGYFPNEILACFFDPSNRHHVSPYEDSIATHLITTFSKPSPNSDMSPNNDDLEIVSSLDSNSGGTPANPRSNSKRARTPRGIKEEIRDYITMSSMEIKKVEAMRFWKNEGYDFPLLLPIALQFLSEPASSASVERVFSSTGLILDDRRFKMSGDSIQAQALMKFNSKVHRDFPEYFQDLLPM